MIRKDVYNKAKQIFGTQAQVLVAIEECGEFIHAASRFINDRENNIVEEIGDVLVMMEQLIEVLDIKDIVAINIEDKLNGLIDEMNRLESR